MDLRDAIVLHLSKSVIPKDGFKVKGHLHLELHGPDGRLKDSRDMENLITNILDEIVASHMAGGGGGGAADVIDHTEIGTGSGQGAGDNVLATPTAPAARVANDSNAQGVGANDNDVIHIATFAPTVGTGAITEAGLFTDLAGNTMCAYQSFAVVTKGAADTLTTTWTITYG